MSRRVGGTARSVGENVPKYLARGGLEPVVIRRAPDSVWARLVHFVAVLVKPVGVPAIPKPPFVVAHWATWAVRCWVRRCCRAT